MNFRQGDSNELKSKFWNALADSPFVFLRRDADPDTAVPMTAQLDKDADSAVWFFTTKSSDFAKLGEATATFQGKDHDVFARFRGKLEIEEDQGRFEQFWNNFVKAWYDGGKDDPDILFLRMDLADAEIWSGELGALTTAKMMMGMDVRGDVQEKRLETTL